MVDLKKNTMENNKKVFLVQTDTSWEFQKL